jgi:DNA-binding NtrC family response regulator
MERLIDYWWPGNVRQLESAIERAILLCEGDAITPRDLPQEVLARKTAGRIERSRGGDRFEIPPDGINFEHLERDLILQAMEKADWVIAKAAKMLGMSYRTLQYRIDKFGIRKPEGRGALPPADA